MSMEQATVKMVRSSCAVLVWLSVAFVRAAPAARQPAAGGPIIDNARVSVWDVTWATAGRPPRLTGDSIAIAISPEAGQVAFRPKGTALPRGQGRSIVIDVKTGGEKAMENRSGYPNAFPRAGVKKVFENDRVIVWDYSWTRGQPTVMHFHDKDVVVVYLEDGALMSTTPDGQKTLNEYAVGMTRFNLRDRSHTEELVKGTQRAIITEFK
jgi:hypothetical protein